jgi:1-acyl-sn-glycerol-3-phosphate acyltransferase
MNFRGLLFLFFCTIGLLFLFPIWWIAHPLITIVLQRKFHQAIIAKPFFKGLYFLLGIKVKFYTPENLATGIILCNHQSILDIGLILGWIKPVSFIAKSELFSIPLFKQALQFTKTLPVHRGQREKNTQLETQLKENIQMGMDYCVFPEGTRSNDSQILPFKSGII